jgi:hypothetical protein
MKTDLVLGTSLRELLIPGVEVTMTSLVVTDPSLSLEEYAKVAYAAGRFKSATSFWIGDLLNFGEKLYGDKYTEAMEATGLSYDTLANYASVCLRVARSRRREGLHFGHHAEVASLEPLQQIEWLEAAVVNGWRRAELRERLRASKDRPDPTPTPAWSDDAPPAESLTEEKVEEAEVAARRTLKRTLPAGHPLWETQAKEHAKDVLALARQAKVSLRDAARLCVEQSHPNGKGVWIPADAFEALAKALAEPEE